MRLLIINGSPKKNKSNTGVMVDNFIKPLRVFDDILVKNMSAVSIQDIIDTIHESDHIILAMPLYGYSMPAQVLQLLTDLYDQCEADSDFKRSLKAKSFGFIIQYGFKEAVHARPLERYLEHFLELIDSNSLGTIIKGGCDALYNQKDKSTGKALLKGLEAIAQDYNKTLEFNKESLVAYSAPEKQKKGKNLVFMKVFIKLVNRYYWRKKYEKNGVSEEESFAKPYA